MSEPAIISRQMNTWTPYIRGPHSQWLECRGGLLAQAASLVHFSWPFARGQWRLMKLVRSLVPPAALADVLFMSKAGVPVYLEVGSTEFFHLSGRLSSEPLEIDVVSRMVRPGDTFVDIGAHLGLYIPHVLGRLGPTGNYIAIEPSLRHAAFLRNAFRDATRLSVLETAVADYDGAAFLCREGEVEGYLSKDSGRPISARRLDSLIPELANAEGVFIKIDAEGQDAAVIRGCAGLAASGNFRPMLMVEFLAQSHEQTRADILGSIEQTLGPEYLFYAVDQCFGLRRFTHLGQVGTTVRNMIALHSSQTDRLPGCWME